MGRPFGPVTCSDTLIRAGDPEAPRLAGLASLTAMGANVIEAIRGAPGEPVGCAASWSLELLDCAATGRPPAQAASTTSRMAIAPAPRMPHSFTSADTTTELPGPRRLGWETGGVRRLLSAVRPPARRERIPPGRGPVRASATSRTSRSPTAG